MEFVANYEVLSDISIFKDDHWFNLKSLNYNARIRNIPRENYSSPFLLALEIKFNADDLDASVEKADEMMVSCLDILAFTTGARILKHGIKQIVSVDQVKGMNDCLFWTDDINHKDPMPIINSQLISTFNTLLSSSIPPPVRKALHWFRMGIYSKTPDDQFQYFWFALEIIATSEKAKDKVNDLCPQCRGNLFCQHCNKHPTHKPYPKDKIFSLIKLANNSLSDETIKTLGDVRNWLMHGSELSDFRGVEEPLKQVDLLGRTVFAVILMKIPFENENIDLEFGHPNTYLHQKVSMRANIQTPVPKGTDGELDLSFKGLQISIERDAKPQSAQPFVVLFTEDEYQKILGLSYSKSDNQQICYRLIHGSRKYENFNVGTILATDIDRVISCANSSEVELFNEVMSSVFKNPLPFIKFV